MSSRKIKILTHMDILTDEKLTWVATPNGIYETYFGKDRKEGDAVLKIPPLTLFIAKMGKRGFKREYCFLLPEDGDIRMFSTAKEARAALVLRGAD